MFRDKSCSSLSFVREGKPDQINSSLNALSSPEKVKSDDTSHSSPDGASSQPKMKYRCKLCGLPKQNHVCAYQQSLQRSIGAQIYPAVNAFTADEPGILAPALSEMNNFVGELAGSECSETSPARPSHLSGKGSPANVTPETLRGTMMGNPNLMSPSSSISFSPHGTPFRKDHGSASRHKPITPRRYESPSRKRKGHPSSPSGNENGDLFVEAMEIKPEQYRIVTPTNSGAYSYASLPLPYAQRKRLSDNLFALSKEIPQLTDECAVVLREARERDMWDQAVAELMTQVVVVAQCRTDRDRRLGGLRSYLLGLGISC